ncbi:MAG: hypothetical protein ACFFCS_03885 [Candidatus Hodarchaeota archaeon]
MKIKKIALLLLFMILTPGISIVAPHDQEEITDLDSIFSSTLTEKLGAFIIVGGDRDDHDKQDYVMYGCNQTYNILLDLGFTENQLYFLAPVMNASYPNVNDYSYYDNINWAIEEWAKDKVNSTCGLGIYLFDHGGWNYYGFPNTAGYICIPNATPSGTTEYSSHALNGALYQLKLNTSCDRNIIIVESCHAGAFSYNNHLSKSDRIIITATNVRNGSYTAIGSTWAAFSESFWSSIATGGTLGDAFMDGARAIIELGWEGFQEPQVEDDHDFRSHPLNIYGYLPNGDDGYDAMETKIQPNLPLLLDRVAINVAPLPFYNDYSLLQIPVWAVIDTQATIDKVWARIVPPDWVPVVPQSDNESTIMPLDEGVEIEEMFDQGGGNYSSVFSVPASWSQGKYKINLMARSTDGLISNIVSTYCTLNQDGSTPADATPPNVSVYVGENATAYIIRARGDDDQALDTIEIYIDDQLVKEEQMPGHYPYPEVVHPWNITAVSDAEHNVTAVARDKNGNTSQKTWIIPEEENENTPDNDVDGYLTWSIVISTIGIILVLIKRVKDRVRIRQHRPGE